MPDRSERQASRQPEPRAAIRADRILGCFLGAAMGDAMGAATECLSRADLHTSYPDLLDCFQAPGPDNHAVDNRKGQITDDASQLAALAHYLIEHDGNISELTWQTALRRWAATSPQRHLMGPTTKAALLGPPGHADIQLDSDGRPLIGLTNGAAMRVAPIGLLPFADPADIVAAARDSALPTHRHPLAVGAACAIAAGVADALLPRSDVESVAAACCRGAIEGASLVGYPSVGRWLADRIERAVELVGGQDEVHAILDVVADKVGTSVLAAESIPAAVALFAAAHGSPFRAMVFGTNVGGDTDTIASMAAALGGALRGAVTLRHLIADLKGANEIDFVDLAAKFDYGTRAAARSM